MWWGMNSISLFKGYLIGCVEYSIEGESKGTPLGISLQQPRNLHSYILFCNNASPNGKLMCLYYTQIHKEKCPNKKTKCSLGCGGLFPDGELETHMKSECPKRLCSCKHCMGDFPLDSLQVT